LWITREKHILLSCGNQLKKTSTCWHSIEGPIQVILLCKPDISGH
jgi:hypothetical protein